MLARPRGFWAVLVICSLLAQISFGAAFVPKLEEKRTSHFKPVCAVLFLGAAIGSGLYIATHPEDDVVGELSQLARGAVSELYEIINPKERRILRDQLLDKRAEALKYCQSLGEEVNGSCKTGVQIAYRTSMSALVGVQIPTPPEQLHALQQIFNDASDGCYALSPRKRDGPNVVACLTSFDKFVTLLTGWLQTDRVESK